MELIETCLLFSDQRRHISSISPLMMVSKLWSMQNTVGLQCVTMQFGNFGIHAVTMRMMG